MHEIITKFWDSTRHMADGFVERLPAFAVGAMVFLVFYVSSDFIARTIRRAVSRRRANLGLVLERLTGGAMILLGLLVALSIVAPSFQAADLIKILGIGGVAIGFAFQNILQNFLAGLLLLWSEPFRIGDDIKLDTFEGIVEDIQARATIIRTPDERRVVIPNADLFTHSVIVNREGNQRRQYEITVKRVLHLNDLKRLLVDAVRSVDGVMPEPPPEAIVLHVRPNTVTLRVLWNIVHTDARQASALQDQVISAMANALERSEATLSRQSVA
jgi:small conductance mechanosensitive channel